MVDMNQRTVRGREGWMVVPKRNDTNQQIASMVISLEPICAGCGLLCHPVAVLYTYDEHAVVRSVHNIYYYKT